MLFCTWFLWFNTTFVRSITVVCGPLTPLLQMWELRPRKRNHKQGPPKNRAHGSSLLPLSHFPDATTAPPCGETSILFSCPPNTTIFSLENYLCPFFFDKEKVLPHSWLQNKILFISPALSFLCSGYKTFPQLHLAITTETNLIYFGRFICAFTLGLSLAHLNDPLQDSLPHRAAPFQCHQPQLTPPPSPLVSFS